MSMEKRGDTTPIKKTHSLEWETFKEHSAEVEWVLDKMFAAGLVYAREQSDGKGKLKSIEIFENDGTLVHFLNIEALNRPKLTRKMTE